MQNSIINRSLPLNKPLNRPPQRTHGRFYVGTLLVVLLLVGGGAWFWHTSAHQPAVVVRPESATLTADIPTPTAIAQASLMPAISLKTKNLFVTKVQVSLNGQPIAGIWSQTQWKPEVALQWGKTYTVLVVGIGGIPRHVIQKTYSLVTPLPPTTLKATVSPSNGALTGMGTIFSLQFAQPIPASLQGQIINNLEVTTTGASDPVGWHWWSNTQVDGRPKNFWPLNDTVTLHANLNGLVMNGHTIINSDIVDSFTVNEQHEIKISANTDRMLVYNAGKLIENYPVSLGRPGFPTLSGTLIVLYKQPVVFMNSASIGYPGIYAENVYLDVAISTDGYFMHSAPWDVYDHGYANVSFGCVEQNPANALWIYNWSEPGDVVIITGTSYHASEVDGEGDWNIPWSAFTVPTVPTPSPSPTFAS